MNASNPYLPSKLIAGQPEILRRHSLTRWLSRDLMQAAVDFCRNLGLFPIYCECSPDHLTRYLFWRLPQGAALEVRSGRAMDQFLELDKTNRENKRQLLSLHINEHNLYSAVWISSDHFEIACTVLEAHGITPVEQKET
jgi:hypothetical protein